MRLLILMMHKVLLGYVSFVISFPKLIWVPARHGCLLIFLLLIIILFSLFSVKCLIFIVKPLLTKVLLAERSAYCESEQTNFYKDSTAIFLLLSSLLQAWCCSWQCRKSRGSSSWWSYWKLPLCGEKLFLVWM